MNPDKIPPQPPIPQGVRELAKNIEALSLPQSMREEKLIQIAELLQSFLTTHNAETIRVLEKTETWLRAHKILKETTLPQASDEGLNESIEAITTHLNKLKEGK